MRESGDRMMSKGDVLLTASDLLRWREEAKQLDEEIRQMQERRSDLRRKLDAAEVFAERLPAPPAGTELEPQETTDSDVSSESAPQALISNLLATGHSLTVKQIKARLIELGFGQKVREQPNYHYQTAYRLTKRGKLLRRGTKYRAAPISSSEEETEAVGASVRS
jgi:hypothetical protein